MDSLQPKKLLIINILDILKKYSDADNPLNQKKIAEILEQEYDMKADRKAIKRNIMNLIEFGYEIGHKSSERMIEIINEDGEKELVKSEIMTDFYLIRDFEDSELRLLIDSLLFSKHIPYSQCKDLIEKIEKLSSKHFESKMRHVCNLPENMPQNKELFHTIDILDKAIDEGKQVAFKYNDMGTDKKLYPRKNSDGSAREYIVNPYQMVATNGRYYLIGNYDKYNNVSNYRVDRITGIRSLDIPVKSTKKVEGLENGLDLSKHMAEHIYMFSDKTERVTFRASKGIVTEIIDWFGKDVRFSNETEDEVTADVRVSPKAMKFWAMQYGEYVTVTHPESLVNEVKTALQKAAEKY